MIRIPAVHRHFKSLTEVNKKVKEYFKLRDKLNEEEGVYSPSSMGTTLKLIPNQVGLITQIYNKTNGEVELALSLVKKKVSGQVWEKKVNIKTNRFLKYSEYCKTKEWKNHRRLAFKKTNSKCALCNNKAETAHHKSYKFRATPNEIKDLIPLCWDCHKLFHAFYEYDSKKHKFIRKIIP